MPTAEVRAIHITPAAGAPAVAVSQVRAVAGRGLEGDRHFAPADAAGQAPHKEVTLIEAEALDALQQERGIALADGITGRNLTTRGVALNDLVGKEFRVGGVRLRGIKLCAPCDDLEARTQPGVKLGLDNRGGLMAQILNDGTIRVGDAVEI